MCACCGATCGCIYSIHTDYTQVTNDTDVNNTGCVSESGYFKNVMNSKYFHLFSFNTHEQNAQTYLYIRKTNSAEC